MKQRDLWCTVTDLLIVVFLPLCTESAHYLVHIYTWVVVPQTQLCNVVYYSILVRVYERLNHVSVCSSYTATLSLIDKVSGMYTILLAEWIADGEFVKFWENNMNKKQKKRAVRSDHHGEMLNMYSILAGKNSTPGPQFSHVGHVSNASNVTYWDDPTNNRRHCDRKSNLVALVSRVFNQYCQHAIILQYIRWWWWWSRNALA